MALTRDTIGEFQRLKGGKGLRMSPNAHRSLNLKEDCRIIITGPSGCGKTQTMVNFLMNDMLVFKTCDWFTWTSDQPALHLLDEFFRNKEKHIQNKRGIMPWKIFTVRSPDELQRHTEMKRPFKRLIVFDDMMEEGKENQKKITEFFISGRHSNMCVVHILQSFHHEAFQKAFKNATHRIAFRPRKKDELDRIEREFGFPGCFSGLSCPHDFLFFDVQNGRLFKNADPNQEF